MGILTASGHQRNTIFFVVVGHVLPTICLLSSVLFHMSLLSGIFVLLNELRDGPNQNQSYLTMTLLYVYLLEFLFFNVWRYSEEKNQDD